MSPPPPLHHRGTASGRGGSNPVRLPPAGPTCSGSTWCTRWLLSRGPQGLPEGCSSTTLSRGLCHGRSAGRGGARECPSLQSGPAPGESTSGESPREWGGALGASHGFPRVFLCLITCTEELGGCASACRTVPSWNAVSLGSRNEQNTLPSMPSPLSHSSQDDGSAVEFVSELQTPLGDLQPEWRS